MSITFDTHGDNKNAETVVHVFVKNRLSNSLTPEDNSDFISNLLAYQRYGGNGDINDTDSNPYLAFGLNLSQITIPASPLVGPAPTPTPFLFGFAFDDPSSHTFHLTRRSKTITAAEVILPVVNIHILAGTDTWIFDYTLTLTFDNGAILAYSSSAAGLPGIILDQDNRNYSGICTENAAGVPPQLAKAVTNSQLKRVTIQFASNDEGKKSDTRLNVHIANRLSATTSQDLAIGLDLFKEQEFPANSTSDRFIWSVDDGSLSSNDISLADIVLPEVGIVIVPTDSNRWMFDYRVTLEFGDPADFDQKLQVYSSTTQGVIIDQDNPKHIGVYQGRSFPTVSPPTAPRLTYQPTLRTKTISLDFLQSKLNEFVKGRNGTVDSHNPPLNRLRFHNGGVYAGVVPESYLDHQSITPLNAHPAPGGPLVAYVSHPTSLGQLPYNVYFDDVNSSSLQLTVDPTQKTPFALSVAFETGGPMELQGPSEVSLDFVEFAIEIWLTLDLSTVPTQFGGQRTVVDVMSWVPEIMNMHTGSAPAVTQPHYAYRYTGTFLGKPVDIESNDSIAQHFTEQVIDVTLNTSSEWVDFDQTVRHRIRDKIFEKLTTPDPFTQKTPRDAINSMVTSWLLGGVADDDTNPDNNNVTIHSISPITDGQITISYSGPQNVFVPVAPNDWPAAGVSSSTYDFSPGSLANIDHIVVLTMENRSFDHMLGYLSLPVAGGGMGRTDIDGLSGDESNLYNGIPCPSYVAPDTLFAPDPPHDHEPVTQAINGGRMDGFAQSYGDAHGAQLAATIMGHQVGASVPTHDALARDFTIGHRWFASHPGPTFCNRFYEVTGHLNLDSRGFWEFVNSSPILPVFTPTIFDHLSRATDDTGEPVTWAYFEYGYCFLRFFECHTFDGTNVVRADAPDNGFFARARAGTLPNVSFIDPHFVEYPPDATCDGPPADVKDGEAFVRSVVEAVIAGPAWNKTMLVIVYDEHGGFYDHVPPPKAPKVSDEFPIETLGVRVPCIVVSPWVGAGTVFGYDGPAATTGSLETSEGAEGHSSSAGAAHALHFDHTSLLKTIARRFMSANPPYMGARYAAAHDLSEVLGNELRQTQFLPFLGYTIAFGASGMMLDIQNLSRAIGAPLWQETPTGGSEQDFAFEDAGDGYVYVRSNLSNLYVTVNATLQHPLESAPPAAAVPVAHIVAPGNEAADVAANQPEAISGGASSGTTANPEYPGLIQDVKYATSHSVVEVTAGGARADLQKWSFAPVGVTALDHDRFMISSKAFPDKVLQPANRADLQSFIVLGDPGETAGPHPWQNAWRVTSPLLATPPPTNQA